MRSHRRRGLLAASTAAGLLAAGSLSGVAQADDPAADIAAVEKAVTLDGTLAHLRVLQQVADVNDGNRAAGTAGYAASAGYVLGRLQAAGYVTSLQQFDFPYFVENTPAVFQRTAPTATTYEGGTDFATFTFSPSGSVTAPVQAVDLVLPPPATPGSTSGCEAEDFAGFTAGNVALVQRGTCDFLTKATNAEAAGASAVIVFNEGQEGRTELLQGTLGEASVGIPVIGVGFELGQELAAAGTTVTVTTDTTNETRSTYNVIAETKGGRADNVVMAGAHLDSVPEGPGINDNGSGSAALLETAIQFAEVVPDPTNKVRFAWWSAEELGLLGAEAYVAGLPEAARGDIALYLNFDMVGSPNFARFVYDGDDSDATGAGPGPQGSAAIEDAFEEYFAAKDLPTEGTDFDGRSDYGPFIENGIPAGGLFTGAEGVKTEEQAARYGGRAGEAFDPCYHQACDTSRNISNRALAQNADAIAHVVTSFAYDTAAVNDRERSAAALRAQSVDAAATEHAGHALTR